MVPGAEKNSLLSKNLKRKLAETFSIAKRKINHHLHPSDSMFSLNQYFKLHIVLLGCTIIFLVVTKIEATGCRLLKDYFFHK